MGRRRRRKNGGEFECFQLGANPLDFFKKQIDLNEHLGLVINLRGVSIHSFITGTRQEWDLERLRRSAGVSATSLLPSWVPQ